MGVFMFIGIGGLIIIGFLYWMLWSKLCDIESKLFRMHDEISSEISTIKEMVESIDRKTEDLDEVRYKLDDIKANTEIKTSKGFDPFYDYIDEIEQKNKAP